MKDVRGGLYFSLCSVGRRTQNENARRHIQRRSIHYITMKLSSVVVCLATAGSAAAFAPAPMGTRAMTVSKMAAAEEYYIDEERRFTMNLILLGSAAVTVGGLAVPFVAFFVPPGCSWK
jgi:hypothetical protein